MPNNYGKSPVSCGVVACSVTEMMFYQDMPLKLPGEHKITREDRLKPFDLAIGIACGNFIGEYGIDRYMSGYVYISAKRLFQSHDCTFNRPGWHCDGFGSDDINYIWYDRTPTVFNCTEFNLPKDDAASMIAMDEQAQECNNFTFPAGNLLRLDQFCVHRVGVPLKPEVRTFLKITISRDRFNLEGNAHNPLLDYNWPLRPRGEARNIPQEAPPFSQGLWDHE